ncbi:unnamed protein product, partial [Phaeothamnion confervicola]
RHIEVGIDGGLACSEKPTGVGFHAQSILAALFSRRNNQIRYHLYLPPGGQIGSDLPPHVVVHRRPDVNVLIKQPWMIYRSYADRLDVFYSFGHRISRWLRGRKIITIHDTIYDQYPEFYPPGVARAISEEVRSALRDTNEVVTVSEDAARSLTEIYRFERPITVIDNAPRSMFSPGLENKKTLNELGIRTQYFLFVGRIDSRKNVKRIVEAYRLLLQQGSVCSLVLVGPI